VIVLIGTISYDFLLTIQLQLHKADCLKKLSEL